VQPGGRLGNLRRAVGLLVGCRADLLGEFVNFGNNIRDLLESRAEVVTEVESLVHDVCALFHVLDGLLGFFLNALNQLGDFTSGLRRLLCELSHFIGDYSEAKPVLTGASRLNSSIESEQIGLLRQIVYDLDDFANVVGAGSKLANDGRGGLNRDVDAIQSI